MSDSPEYSAPAIDKALDILELLAESSSPMSQLEIATAIGLSAGQIFRPLLRLEKRGYLSRDKQSGLYQLSLRMFDLAHRQEPLRSLLSVAVPIMRELAAEIGQSCNLGTLDNRGVRIVAQVESPADFGFRVRVGALFDLAHTATGMVLAAFSDEPCDGVAENVLKAIRRDGIFVLPDSAQPGITDVVVPILRSDGREALAAITVPYISTSYSPSGVDAVLERTAQAAQRIQVALGL
ncbi:IclR family transcriptional regulator [Leifsonia sp. P73]|uniref:IclR family transcriptional regulator n=1 Tax=Leifsonia sp. P73 TaxID=3423959 RepID=UPI003DA53C44